MASYTDLDSVEVDASSWQNVVEDDRKNVKKIFLNLVNSYDKVVDDLDFNAAALRAA